MINNLFSIFDPSTYYISAGWVILITPIVILMSEHNNSLGNNFSSINGLTNIINNEVLILNSNDEKNSTSEALNNLFFVVISLNLVAILPVNFTPTAHISVTMFLSLTIWVTTIINATINFMVSTITHLTPIGTPAALMNFIVLIEIISNLIRPITLAVRLTANIVAGHLLISLLSNFSMVSSTNALISWVPTMTLVALEIAVATIQAYVITVLICLYYKETF